MIIEGKMKVNVDIEPSEAIKVIEDFFGVYSKDPSEYFKIVQDRENGKKNLYKVSSDLYDDRYSFITDDPDKINLFISLQLLKESIRIKNKIK